MSTNEFIYKVQLDFSITSSEIELSFISNELNIVPERYFIKGEKSVSKHSGSITTRPHNLWAIKSKISYQEDETISQHIRYFKDLLLPKTEILKKYKESDKFNVVFYIWIETNDAGIGFDLNSEEVTFLNSISNSIHFSVISNSDVDD